MSDETKTSNTNDQAAADATGAQEPNQSTPQPGAGKPAKAATKKTTKPKTKAKAPAKKAPPPPPVSKRPPEVETAKPSTSRPTMMEVTAEEAIEITGAVVRPEGEPNGKTPEPIPAEPDDVLSMKVDGNRVSLVTIDGQKFSGEIA